MTSFSPPSGRAGRARQIEIGKENTAAIEIWKKAMLEGLGRPATAPEELLAETISSLFIRARRLRDLGRDDTQLLPEAALLQNNSVFRDPRALPPAGDQ